MHINKELADKYQEFFNFFSQEHNLTLCLSEMHEILLEAKKLESKLREYHEEVEKTALSKLLEWCEEFEDAPVKPTLTNMKEKIWQLIN
jgi:Ca2+-binding EF-hand superfamily protein